jgi:hypothetical protein
MKQGPYWRPKNIWCQCTTVSWATWHPEFVHPWVMEQWLADYGPPSLQSLSCTQLFEPLTKRSANSSWLQTIYTNLFCTRTQTLVPPCETCLNVIGDHVHVWCISSATYMPSMHQIRTLLGMSVFVTLFPKLLWRLPCILRNNTDWLRRSTMLKCFIFLLTEWDWQQNIMV